MVILWRGMKATLIYLMIALLLTVSVLMFNLFYSNMKARADAEELSSMSASTDQQTAIVPSKKDAAIPKSATISAPIIKQHPELPSGCEVTSLAMLLQYAGVNKSKMDLASEVHKDSTPIVYSKDGKIQSWGNPNTGYVGDMTGEEKGFAIYHTGLFPLLQKYIPTAKDFTGANFEDMEKQVSEGIPVVIWTTIEFIEPKNWVTWETPTGPITTTFSEHAVLLVGFDESNVYVNDPINGKSNFKVDKAQFIKVWDAMGRQALSYSKS